MKDLFKKVTMKKYYYFLLALLLILLHSCNENDSTIKIKKFPEEIKLTSKPLPYSGTHKAFDIHLLKDDSLALFFTIYDADYCIRIINLNTLKLISSAGKIGKGPGEIINPGYAYIDKLNNNIWVSSGGKFYLMKFPVDSIISNDNYIPATKVNLNEFIINYTIDNDSLKFYNVLDKEKILYKRQKGENKGIIDKALMSTNKMEEFTYNFSNFRLHPSKEKIVLAYLNIDLLIITDTIGNVIRKITGPNFINPLKNKNSFTTTYQDIEVDDQYIYCLFSGKDKFMKDENGRSIRIDSKSILIFDWNGNPIRRINLDRSLFRFDIDKKNNRFLAYSSEVENGLIEIKYDF